MTDQQQPGTQPKLWTEKGPNPTGAGDHAPLPARLRPRSFDEFVGQEHLLAQGTVLRQSIEADEIPSIVLWGPPGSGKTTLAHLIATTTKAHFAPVSAVASGVAELRRIVQEAKTLRQQTAQGTVLFIDEVHRFSKTQQDAILPYVEDGTVTFIGATTENPAFEVISPLLSRARVFPLKPLGPDHLKKIVRVALKDVERGLGSLSVDLSQEAEELLLGVANGDARVALNLLALATSGTPTTSSGKRVITTEIVEDAAQQRSLRYDKDGSEHYDTISAFIKSIRGSDPDASVYWLARMLEAGEDPLFIARRLVILAAEDIGLADPQALPVAVAVQQALHFIGMPEGFLPLAEGTLYLATAPKSNSALTAYSNALEDVRRTSNLPIPLHLRNTSSNLTDQLGYGKDYRYAHSYRNHQVEQQHLPDTLAGNRYYEPGDQGHEIEISKRLRLWRKR